MYYKFQFSLLNYSQKELSNNLFESSFLLFVFIPYGNCAYPLLLFYIRETERSKAKIRENPPAMPDGKQL